jgi:long-chain acyl-CoA synthetase
MTKEKWPNIVQMFFEQADLLQDKPFVWQKVDGSYHPTTWTEAKKVVINLATFLRNQGVKDGERVVLVSENRSEWGLCDLAIMAAGGISVPTYTTNTSKDHAHILNNSQAMAAIVSTQKLADQLLPATLESNDIQFVISIEDLKVKQSSSHNIFNWKTVTKAPINPSFNPVEFAKSLSREETACIIYTSGTGGVPKGVMLPHRSMLHICKAAIPILEKMGLGDEAFLSFLPLSHSYEHTAGFILPIYIGAEIYYAESIESLANNMQECRPTLMTAVPRLYETMRQKILRGLSKQSTKKQKLFSKTHELGRKKFLNEKLSLWEGLQNIVLEKLVRKKVRMRFGGRLKAMISGGGPLNPDVGIFFQALGLRVLQGYGQTESGPVASVNIPNKIKMHTVGPALLNTDIKIANDGEILLRGDLLMNGYWRDEKATNSTIIDGWLHTGDVGVLDEDNFLQITDRKKDIIVNSGGDNISPQRLEGLLCLQSSIAQAMVYGDNRPHLVALIVPDEDYVKEWAADQNIPYDYKEIVLSPEFKKHMTDVVSKVNANLSKIERIRKFMITDQAFSLENEMMTPTLKIRRHVIKEAYENGLQNLY